MFYLKLLINSLLVSYRVKLTGTPSVITIRSSVHLKPGESSGSAPRGFSRLASCAGDGERSVTFRCPQKLRTLLAPGPPDRRPRLQSIFRVSTCGPALPGCRSTRPASPASMRAHAVHRAGTARAPAASHTHLMCNTQSTFEISRSNTWNIKKDR
jgi:hypothetical protein